MIRPTADIGLTRAANDTTDIPSDSPFLHGVVDPHGRFSFLNGFGFAFGTEIARQESGKLSLYGRDGFG